MKGNLRTVLCLVCTLSALPGQGRSPERLTRSGRFAKLSTDRQIEDYQKLLATQPKNYALQNLLASAFIQKVRETTDFTYLDRASRIVEQILSSDPGNYEAMRLRSEIGLERHQFAEVAGYSEELAKIAPGDPWNWGTLGDSLMEAGEYDRAGSAYEKMLAIRANQSSYNRIAYHRFVTGDAKAAIQAMTLAVAAGSPAPENTAWCLVELGHMYFKTGRLDPAEKSYQAALALFPNYHSAYGGLGAVLAAESRRQAIDSYKRAQAAVPLLDYAAALHDLYLAAGKLPEAEKENQFVDVVDKLGQASGEKTNRTLAIVYADQDRRLDRALELMKEELKVRQDVYTYDALAWVLFKRKDYAGAGEAMEKALRMKTPEPIFYYHAGRIAAASGQTAKARKYLAAALALNPKFDVRHAPQAQKALLDLSRQEPAP